MYGVTTQTIGIFYLYVGAISLLMRGLLLGPTLRWLGEIRVMRTGIVALFLGFILLPQTSSIPELAVTMLLIPVGMALVFPANTSLVSKQAPEGETGQTLGVQQAFGGISRLLGPLWAGAVFQYVGITAPFYVCAALALVVLSLAMTLRIEETPSSGGVEAVETASG